MLMPLALPHYSSSPRHALQRGLALVSFLMSVLWFVFYERMSVTYPLNHALYLLLIATSAGALLAPPRLRERAVAWGAFVYLSVLLVAWLDAFYQSYGSTVGQFTLLKVVFWLPAVYSAFFLVYRSRTALRVSLGALGVFILTSLPHAFATASDGQLFGGFLLPLALLIGHGACAGTLYAFTRPSLPTLGVSEDVTQLQRFAYYDTLTGVPNRRQMNLLLRAALIEARKGGAFAVIMIDFDHFKRINDAFGHGVGDAVLSAAVQKLAEPLRTGDVLGRWGGEEFIVLVRYAGEGEALRRAERLREAVEVRPLAGNHTVTVSCGVAVYEPGDTLELLIARADRALYGAKRGGRNRVEATLQKGRLAD